MLENKKYPYCYRVRREVGNLYKALSGCCKVALRGLPHTFYLELMTILINRASKKDDPLNLLISKYETCGSWRLFYPDDCDAVLDIIEEEIITLLANDIVLYNNTTIPKVLRKFYDRNVYWIVTSLTPFLYEVQEETR